MSNYLLIKENFLKRIKEEYLAENLSTKVTVPISSKFLNKDAYINFDIVNGLGATQGTSSWYKSVLTHFSPFKFLSLVSDGLKLAQIFKEQNKKFPIDEEWAMPVLFIEPVDESQKQFKIKSHEGRHRMAFLYSIGVTENIPVQLFCSEYCIPEEFSLISEFDDDLKTQISYTDFDDEYKFANERK